VIPRLSWAGIERFVFIVPRESSAAPYTLIVARPLKLVAFGVQTPVARCHINSPPGTCAPLNKVPIFFFPIVFPCQYKRPLSARRDTSFLCCIASPIPFTRFSIAVVAASFTCSISGVSASFCALIRSTTVCNQFGSKVLYPRWSIVVGVPTIDMFLISYLGREFTGCCWWCKVLLLNFCLC
jgi:hypothetical protein